MRTLVLALLCAPGVAVAAAPACSVESLTSSCDFFAERANQEFISLPDGTRYRNPLSSASGRLVGEEDKMPPPFDPGAAAENARKLFSLQARSLRALKGHGTEEFLLALTSGASLSTLGYRKSMEAARKDAPPNAAPEGPGSAFPLMLPWPPDQPGAAVRLVSPDEFRSGFLDKLPESARKDFDKVVAAAAEQIQAMPQAQMIPQPKRIKVPPARRKRVDHLVEETRSALLGEILRGRKYGQLSPAERAMHDKIATVRFRGGDDPTIAGPSCQGAAPNAFYNPDNHTFTLCPNFYEYPDAQLVSVIGHEMGHAIDPCGCQFHAHEIDRDRLREKQDVLLAQARKDPKRMKAVRFLLTSPDEMTSGYLGRETSDEAIEWLERSGAIRRKAAAVSPEDYPYREATQCLKEQVGFRETSDQDLRKTAKAYARRVAAAGGSSIDRAEVEADALRSLRRFPQCPQTIGGPSQSGEAVADMLGAKVLGKYLSENPPKTIEEKIGAISAMSAGACQERAALDEGFSLDVPPEPNPHPYPRERLDGIYLTDARVRKALGCAQPAGKSCLTKMGPTPSTSSADESPGSGTGGRQ